MKKTITVFIFLFAGITMFAQDELRARMELKNAETAYSEGRYADALKHLDKTQASLGKWSHQISYLRILSLDKLCNYGDMQNAYFQQLQQEVAQYLDYNRANAGKAVMEKVEEVFAVEEHLNNELKAQEAWTKIDQTSQTDLQGYLASYPHSAKTGYARNLLGDIQKREVDLQRREAWEQVKDTEDETVLRRFIRDYAGTSEAQAAENRLNIINPMGMVFVQGGVFIMGCTAVQGSDCNKDEKPAHQVTVKDFLLGRYEVTQAQWKSVMGGNPSKFKGDDLPVENVSWNDVQEFVSKLNTRTGQEYRLPTEAEWEFAAGGGIKNKGYKYSGSNSVDDVAWYNKNSGNKTHEVGSKQPNELGIYDMSGNVWEWCNDWKGKYGDAAQTNPSGPPSGTLRVLRGGSWDSDAESVRVSRRADYFPKRTYQNMGFRLARDIK